MNKPDPIKAYLAKIGSKGGSAGSKAQNKARAENGKKGGRPRKDSAPKR